MHTTVYLSTYKLPSNQAKHGVRVLKRSDNLWKSSAAFSVQFLLTKSLFFKQISFFDAE